MVMYVGLTEFASYKEAFRFCERAKLSPTLIHHEPLKLPRRFQLQFDQALTSDEYWCAGDGDD